MPINCVISARLPALLALVLAASAPTAAAANEQRLFALANGVIDQRWAATLFEAAIVDGRVVSIVPRVTVPGRAAESLFDLGIVSFTVVGGGRFVVWRQYEAIGSAEAVVVFDRTTGQATVVDALPTGLGVADPTRARLLAHYQNQIASVSAEGVIILPNTAGLIPRAMSRDGRRVFAVRALLGLLDVRELVVLDSTSGQLLQTVPLPEAPWRVPEIAVAADESRAWLLTEAPPSSGGALSIQAFDMNTGMPVVGISLAPSFPVTVTARGLVLDDEGARVAVSLAHTSGIFSNTSSGEIRIFDLSGTDMDRTAVEGYSTLHFDRGTRTMLSFSHSEVTFPLRYCSPAVVRALSPLPGTPPTISRAVTPQCLVVAFASPPVAPHLNEALISVDRTVALSWISPPELTTGFVVEAGSAPGLADIATLSIASGTALTVPDVPPGSYYVRVRARNDIGASVPSNEVRVDVP